MTISGLCHRMGPACVDGVIPVGPTKSPMTWERPKSDRAARPSSVISMLFYNEPVSLWGKQSRSHELTPFKSPWTMGAGLQVWRYFSPSATSRIYTVPVSQRRGRIGHLGYCYSPVAIYQLLGSSASDNPTLTRS